MSAAEVTLLRKAANLPLTKRISLGPDGALISDGSACVMSCGTAWRFGFERLQELAAAIEQFGPNQALALGRLRSDLPSCVEVTAKRKLNGASHRDVIARTREFLVFSPGEPALALVDVDQKGMPSHVAQNIERLGGFWPALISVLPPLADAGRILRRSTSAGLFRTDTGEKLAGSGGLHIFLALRDGSDVERFLKTLHARCWLCGFGWMMVGAGGQLLERSIVDRLVGSPERLVFEGPPLLDPPLAQDKASRRPVATEGEALDSVAACSELSLVEQAKLRELHAKEAARLRPEAERARKAFVAEQAERLGARTGMASHLAARVIERQCAGILLPDVLLPFDDDDLAGATVADVLSDPARFEDATLADPLEGIQYGACKAKIMRRPDGTPWINSFAHGRTVYDLKFDYPHAEAALNKASPEEIPDLFVRYVLAGELGEDGIERLRKLASELGALGRRSLDVLLKKARNERIAKSDREEREQRLAGRRDPRPQITAPAPDAPWLPQMEVLNDVLGASGEPEPPMRDIDGVVVQVRVRPMSKMHAFTELGANDEETNETRLPSPEQPLLTRLSEAELAELIERHIDYFDEKTERSVHLNRGFVHHFHTRDDDKLPIVTGSPHSRSYWGNGTLLEGRGLDRERGIVFRVPPELSAILPSESSCTQTAVAEAMRFLTDEWLCDVACDYAGKCVLIAAALTVIERSLLADRPTFWITAGRRGGGKTTTIIMLIMAVTGIRPAAAAWSPNEEERRKALLAYLLQALPCIVWDNIPRGSQISCAHIEKSCTSEFYSDRKLGVSETIAASAATIHFLTGNNIGPRGDLSSRSLYARLSVDRPDPENREFRHPDPIAWTEAHRGEILSSLYTILLGNPRFNPGAAEPPQTRFKAWWSLVGQAVEHGAEQHQKHVAAMVVNVHPTCPPVTVKFKDLFLTQEEDDQESAELADVLVALADQWPGNKEKPEQSTFQAKDVAELINTTGEWATADRGDRGEILREFLFPGVPLTRAVTARAVGKRLRRHVDEPVRRNDEIFTLKAKHDPHTKTWVFSVARR